MDSVQLISGLANGVFVVAVLVVAVRLLLLSRKTRQLPEFCVGLGFFLIAGAGLPLTALSGIGRVTTGELVILPLVLGYVTISIGIMSVSIFTWKVFRPNSAWAAALALASGAAALFITFGSVRAWTTAPPDSSPLIVAAGWIIALRVLFQIWYLWTGVESILEWRKARRRLALGLSDPVVVNRFLLWGSMGLVESVINVVAVSLELQGYSPVVHVLPAIMLAVNGLIAASLMILTFMPPRRYVAFIRQRAAIGA